MNKSFIFQEAHRYARKSRHLSGYRTAFAAGLKRAHAEAKAAHSRDDIAMTLNRAAKRAFLVNAAPASNRQISYLASLIAKAGDFGADCVRNSNFVLTSRKASFLIDTYL